MWNKEFSAKDIFFPLFVLFFLLLSTLQPTLAAPSKTISVTRLSPPPNYALSTDTGDAVQLTDGKTETYPIWINKGAVGWQLTPVRIDIAVLAAMPNATLRIHTACGVYSGTYFPRRIDIYTQKNGNWQYLDNIVTTTEPSCRRDSWLEIPLKGIQSKLALVLHSNGEYIFLDEIELIVNNDRSPSAPNPLSVAVLNANGGTSAPATQSTTSGVAAVAEISDSALVNDSVARLKASFSTAANNAATTLLGPAATNAASGLLVWQQDPWPAPEQWLQAVPDTTPNIRIAGTDREKIPICLGLLPRSSATISEVRINFADTASTAASRVRQLMPVLAANGVRAYDRLAATTDGKISTSTTEPSYVWVDIDLSKFSAGQHTLALQIIDTKTQKQLTSIPITIDVVHDDATPAPLDVITWSYLNGSPIWHDQAAAFAELLSGGTNVFVIHPANIPGLSLAGDWDKTQEQEFDRQVNLFKSHGQILLVLSWYLGHNPFEAAGDDPDKLAKINKAYYAWLAKLTQHLDSLGVSRQQWGLFITDEPHDKSLELLERIAAYTRRYDPAIRVYANPIPPDNPVSQMLTLSKMTETISIWQPQLLVVESASGYFFRQMKQPWWLYTGPTSPAKAASPMIHYRALPWQAWRFGAVGVGFWAFSDTGRNSGALNDFDGEGPDFAVVYETSSGQGIESSRRWEAFKQGMQDYRLLASAQLNRLEIQSSANYDSAKMDATRAAALAVLRQRNTAKP